MRLFSTRYLSFIRPNKVIITIIIYMMLALIPACLIVGHAGCIWRRVDPIRIAIMLEYTSVVILLAAGNNRQCNYDQCKYFLHDLLKLITSNI